MASRRRSIEIEGASHAAGIPMGCRIDNIVYSSAIMGADTSSGSVPDDGTAQVRFAFANLAKFLAAADVSPDDVVRLTVLLEDNSLRPIVNEEWEKMFPDPTSRPARHAMVIQLAANYLVQLEVVAVAES